MPPLEPFILTLKLDEQSFAMLDALRVEHFPRERNFIPAHITLFHALPAEHELLIQDSLEALCQTTPVLPVSLPKPRFLGRGVALEVNSPDLVRLRKRLAVEWEALLGPQDRQGYRPHITIQNKVTSAQARQLYERLSTEWAPMMARGEGLLLWRYKGGPWDLAGEFLFSEA